MQKYLLLKYLLCAAAALAAAATLWALKSGRRISRPGRIACLAAFAGAAALLYATALEPNWIAVERVVVRNSALAEPLGGLRVVQISDLHVRNPLGFRERELVRLLKELKPDLVFITGDLLDDIQQLPPLAELLREVKARYGVYGVPGNSDHHRLNMKPLVRELAKSGLVLLTNEHRRVAVADGKAFWLAGVDDPVTKRANLKRTLQGIPPGEPVLLLAHAPSILAQAAKAGIGLVLVGHTHGGQVGIPLLVRLSKYANRSLHMSGLVQEGDTAMYVNRGIGTKTLPVRLLCRPEIALIEIRNELH